MTTNEFRFTYQTGDKFHLLNLADLHSGHSDFSVKNLTNDLDKYVDDRTIIWGNGDWFDSITTKDKRYSKQGDNAKTTAIINDAIDGLYPIFHKYRKRVIGLGLGNHEMTYIDHCNADPVRFMCNMLSDDDHKVQQFGYSAYIRFRFTHVSGGNVKTFTVYQHHGHGTGGTTDGHSTTKYGKKKGDYDADLYYFGHDHKRDFTELAPIIRLSGDLKLKESRRFMVFPGSYLKTLNDEIYPNYAEVKSLPPIAIGTKLIELELLHATWELRDVS